MQDREERLMGLAREALRTPPAQRETFLRDACHQDQDLYSEVSEIVEWEERMGDFMRDPLVGLIDLEALDRPFKRTSWLLTGLKSSAKSAMAAWASYMRLMTGSGSSASPLSAQN
jgi:hypothetical protein